eukprot:3292674-Rhodomonas_salina.2
MASSFAMDASSFQMWLTFSWAAMPRREKGKFTLTACALLCRNAAASLRTSRVRARAGLAVSPAVSTPIVGSRGPATMPRMMIMPFTLEHVCRQQ